MSSADIRYNAAKIFCGSAPSTKSMTVIRLFDAQPDTRPSENALLGGFAFHGGFPTSHNAATIHHRTSTFSHSTTYLPLCQDVSTKIIKKITN